MRPHARVVVFIFCLSALFTSAVAGCSTSDNSTSGGGMMGNGGSSTMPGGGSNASPAGGMMGGGGSGTNSYSSVGERIYLTGVGADGQKISRNAPAVSQGSLMMGGGGCGSCHGADGRGGTIKMMMGTAVEVPDITYDALVNEGFTDATIGRAIRDGLDESGKPLEDAMPRWQMSDADVGEVIAYLKQLTAQ
jgi:cytochrome c oxidase subunit 2